MEVMLLDPLRLSQGSITEVTLLGPSLSHCQGLECCGHLDLLLLPEAQHTECQTCDPSVPKCCKTGSEHRAELRGAILALVGKEVTLHPPAFSVSSLLSLHEPGWHRNAPIPWESLNVLPRACQNGNNPQKPTVTPQEQHSEQWGQQR